MMRPDAGGSEAKYKGVRKRKWGKWVSEVRLPNSRDRIWLGSYDSPEKAARAFDAAVFCLRGRKAQLNFPDNPPQISAARSLSHQQIQAAAARHANSAAASAPSPPQPQPPALMSPAVSSPEVSDGLTVESVDAIDWSFLDFMTEGFPAIDEFSYDFMTPPAPPDAGAEEGGSGGSGTYSFLWNFEEE